MDVMNGRAWLFPPTRGTFEGISLDALDPADEDERAILIRAEHPELLDAIEQDRDEVAINGVDVNPRLHLTLHEAVAGQVWNEEPPEVWGTAARLITAGYDRHEILHMLGSVITTQFWELEHDGVPPDRDRFVAALDALPGSWEDSDDDDLDELLDTALRHLAERGPLTPDELATHLGADAADMEVVTTDPMVVMLADERLASVAALVGGTVFTHRLSDEEVMAERLPLGTDLSPALSFLCSDDHLHLTGGEVATVSEDDGWLEGPEGWLDGAAAGDVVGLRLADETPRGDAAGADEGRVTPTIEIVADPGDAVVPDTLPGVLEATFRRFGEGDGVPVRPIELVCQLAVDAPALVAGVMAPLSEVLEGAGFELHDGYTAPVGTDWDGFDRMRGTASAAVRHDLDIDQSHALIMVCEMCRRFGMGIRQDITRDLARAVTEVVADVDVAEAFADATVDEPERTMEFIAHMRSLAIRRDVAPLAWVESLVAGRAGAVSRAEACLREGLAADAHHESALEDSAWYASDRGDARQAVRFLERLDEDPDEDRTDLLRRYAEGADAGSSAGNGPGRNDPCPCGSGRKYKQCCLRARRQPGDRPLPDRVRWLWEKLRWWLDRAGREDEVLMAALALHGGPPKRGDTGFDVDFDIASSLVLFNDRAIRDFLEQRGPLLPDDERNLVAQWSLTERSVHEVVDVDAGDGFRLRDLRTGDVIPVRERRGSQVLSVGDLICAHPVFDGEGHQLIGGIVPVPLYLRQPLLDALDGGAGSAEVALLLGGSRRPPELVTAEGEPMVMCKGTYRVDDPGGVASQLDSVLQRREVGTWVQSVELDGRPSVQGTANVDGDVLTLSANSEERFERLRDAVTAAVAGLEPLDEQRTPAAEALDRVARTGGAGHDQALPAGATDALAAFMRQQEERWIDESVPALAGLTPRQAAADPTRREDLLALLHEFDRSPVPAGGSSFDARRLRALLGLTDP